MKIILDSVVPTPMAEQQYKSDVWAKKVELIRGTHYDIVAASGRGKTTLLSLLFGLRTDYTGRITFDDENIAHYSLLQWSTIRKNKLSIVFQGLKLFDDLSGLENVCIKNIITQHKTTDEIVHILESIGLKDCMHKKVGVLSFGQKQRIAIVRALCQPFAFILLDEPFSHVDAETATRVHSYIADEAARQQASIITTHLQLSDVTHSKNTIIYV